MSTHDNGWIDTPDWHVDPHNDADLFAWMVAGCMSADETIPDNIELGNN